MLHHNILPWSKTHIEFPEDSDKKYNSLVVRKAESRTFSFPGKPERLVCIWMSFRGIG